MLRNSLEKFGDLGGIVLNVSPDSGQIVGGHQRVVAFREATSVEEHIEKRYDEPTRTGTVAEGYLLVDGERFGYREVLWDAPTEMAANLSANQQAGEFDYAEVDKMLSELQLVDFDVDLTMFDVEERASLAHSPEASTYQNQDEPETPDFQTDSPPIERSTVFSMGTHRLMCGDSCDPNNIRALLNGCKVDMVYTDPPYGMKLNTNFGKVKGLLKKTSVDGVKVNGHYRPVIGDDADFDPSLILSEFSDVKEVFLWGADYYCQNLPKEGSWLVWDKRSKADGEAIDGFHGAHFELCWSKTKHQRQIARILWMGMMVAENEGARVHPTQKPTMLAEWFFERWGQSGDNVVDLFGGSGSTLLACEKQDRRCFMMEMDPGYCQVIIDRWEKLTGQKAVKL